MRMEKIYLKPASVNGNFNETETKNVDIYFDDDKALDGEDAW